MDNIENTNESSKNSPYKVGSIVPENGWYACVPCGNKRYLKVGTRFGSCLKCLGKERKEFRKGFELWEKLKSKIIYR